MKSNPTRSFLIEAALFFIFLALALLFSACTERPKVPDVLDPTRLEIVSGDHQVGEVSATSFTNGAVVASVAEGVLPDTLVARVVGDTVPGTSAYAGPTGIGPLPNFNVAIHAPPGTVVSYESDVEGCGAPYIQGAVPPDSDNLARNLWEMPGSRAGLTGHLPEDRLGWYDTPSGRIWAAECHMLAHLKVGMSFRADTPFTSYVRTGPAASLRVREHDYLEVGDSIGLLSEVLDVADANANRLPHDTVTWTPSVIVADTEMDVIARASVDGISDSTRVIAVRRIQPGWTYTQRCGSGYSPWRVGTFIDSLAIEAVVDSVGPYPGKAFSDHPVQYAIYLTGTTQIWISSNDAQVYPAPTAYGIHQAPGGMILESVLPETRDTLAADGNPPSAFVSTAPATCGTAPGTVEIRPGA